MNFVHVDFCCCWAYGCIYRHSCFSVKCCLYTAGSQKLAAFRNSHIWRTALTSLNLHMWFKPHLLDFCDFAVGKVNDHVTPVVMMMMMMMNNQAQARSSSLHPRDWQGSLENTPFQEEPNLFLIKKKTCNVSCFTRKGDTNTVTAPPLLDIHGFLMVSYGFGIFCQPAAPSPWHVVLGFHTFWTPCDFESPRGQEWAWERVRKVWVQIDGYLGTPVLVVWETKRKTKGKHKPTQNDFENQHLLI